MPAVIVKDLAVPAVKPLYCPEAGSFIVKAGEETKESVLTVHEVPVVVTVIVTLVPVVALDAEVVVDTSVKHCAANAGDENNASVRKIIISANAVSSFSLGIFLSIFIHS